MNVLIITKKSLADQPPTGPDSIERQIAAKLLGHGGSRVAIRGHEPHAAIILARGQLFTKDVCKARGKMSECHANSAELWERHLGIRALVTGFALDGEVWHQHSWVVDDKYLYETTSKSDGYFGAPLTPKEAAHFWWSNWLLTRHGVVWKLMLEAAKDAGF
jgi:hypothetical protein